MASTTDRSALVDQLHGMLASFSNTTMCSKRRADAWCATLTAAIGALAPPSAQTGWQPIETAPKDGTRIVTFGRLGHVIVGYDAERKHMPEKQQSLGYSCWRVDWDGEYLASEPTHWIPLLESPEGGR
jgi:hypothetical protein